MNIQTAKLERGAEAVQSHPTVKDTYVTDRTTDQKLEIVLLPQVDRVPPGVLRSLAHYDCGIASAQPQGNHITVEVV